MAFYSNEDWNPQSRWPWLMQQCRMKRETNGKSPFFFRIKMIQTFLSMRKNQNETKLRIKFNPAGTNLLHLVGIELFGEFPFFFQTRDLNPIVCSLRLPICDALFFFPLEDGRFCTKILTGIKIWDYIKGQTPDKIQSYRTKSPPARGNYGFSRLFFFFRLTTSPPSFLFNSKYYFEGFYSC